MKRKTKAVKGAAKKSRFGQPLDSDGNCICPEALKPHAQHKPADPIEPGCQGSYCADGTCRTCAAVPDDQWIAWKRVAHAPKVKRGSRGGLAAIVGTSRGAAALREAALALVEQRARSTG